MQQRLKDFDFDLTIQRFSFSATPGDSLRTYFSSQAAALKGSQNLAGIADPAIDALIDRVIAANSRAELTIACRALDRRDPRRPLLDSALVQGVALDRLLGYVRPAADQAALCSGRAGNVVARSAQGGQNRAAGIEHDPKRETVFGSSCSTK